MTEPYQECALPQALCAALAISVAADMDSQEHL